MAVELRGVADGVLRRGARWTTRRVRRLRIGSALTPVDRHFGFGRGTPIDRVLIERFLRRYSSFPGYAPGLMTGDVLEIGGREYADRFAGTSSSITVLHATPDNDSATIVGDLADPGSLPRAAFDAIICTQVLPVIWDVPAALRTLHHALRPGGALFVTVPGITKALTPDRDAWGDFWRFTPASLRRLLELEFDHADVSVWSLGNLGTATAFLHGLAAEDVSARELELDDADYPVILAALVVRHGG